jgi:phage terminase small subunit
VQNPDSKTPPKRAFSFRESEFIRCYIGNDGNGTQAALAAGYAPKGAATAARRLLDRPAVAAAIEKTKERYLKRLDDTMVMNLEQARRALSLAIEATIKRGTFRPQEVNAMSNAIDKLGHISGWQQDNLNLSGEVGLPQLLAGVAEKLKARRLQAQKEGTA